jgi:hypothetical protein
MRADPDCEFHPGYVSDLSWCRCVFYHGFRL